jgi:magnesium chelatase family protein
VRKEGPLYDLPIALGVLAATDQLDVAALDDWLIAGELSLSANPPRARRTRDESTRSTTAKARPAPAGHFS